MTPFGSRHERTIEFMNELGNKLHGREIPSELWNGMVVLTGGSDYHRPFGFSAPEFLAYDDLWAFFYCVELFVDSVSSLEDEEFEVYLRYVKAHLTGHTTVRGEEYEVDDAVFAVMPEARTLLAKVFEALYIT